MHLLVIEDERALCETIVRSLRRTQMPRVLQNASKQRGQRVVRLLSSWCLRSKVRLIVITSVSLL